MAMTIDVFATRWVPRSRSPDKPIGRPVRKYVASRGTPEQSWDTSTQISDVATQVPELRERHRQIHTWGSANLLQTLFREGLVDQVNLWVCPVVLGQGKKLSRKAQQPPASSWSSRRNRSREVRC
jgi:dihydrofolate reductase